MADNQCNWIVREGTHNTYWAFTPCKKGFNPLTRIKTVDEIIPAYENRMCPICGKNIHMNIDLVSGLYV